MHTLTGGTATIPGGPVASQEAIKELGTNGGGFFNANSAHPFENPTGFSNLLEIVLLLLIPFALTRVFGLWSATAGRAARCSPTMVLLFVIALGAMTAFEIGGRRHGHPRGRQRDGGEGAALRDPTRSCSRRSTTLTSTGAVNSMHDSFTPLGGLVTIIDMMFGELAPGGTAPASTAS